MTAPAPAPAPALEGPLAPTLFKVIHGSPTPEELAAVVALLTALTAGAPPNGEEDRGATARWTRAEATPPSSWKAI
ncbi:acyl-CoA carboxylase subunit epsilon [Streptomyces sp. NPDC059009]|uniref:acyl-CoA carboxylase subunit epsilon n=1 Tax=Streptomyces sp. NPDC059009 TaxID=3346694 RepID=UPI0036C6B7D6